MFDGVPDAVIGPQGALVLAIVGLVLFGKDHLRADKEDRKQRDDAAAVSRTQVDVNRDQVAATNRLAVAFEALATDVRELRREVSELRRDLERK